MTFLVFQEENSPNFQFCSILINLFHKFLHTYELKFFQKVLIYRAREALRKIMIEEGYKNENECKMLQKLVSLHLQMSDYEDRKIFFLGARENYFYFKNLGLIKE